MDVVSKQRALADSLRSLFELSHVAFEGERAKDRAYRLRLRRKAIHRLGGCCSCCGFDVHEALEFCHINPVYRTRGESRECAEKTYRTVLRGCDNIKLMCANCHTIETRLQGDYGGRLAHMRMAYIKAGNPNDLFRN